MTDPPERCALCARPLLGDWYEVLDLDGITHACEGCYRRAQLDAELEDALHGG